MTALIDLAGSHAGGGAGRFRAQVFDCGRETQAIGLDTFLTSQWLLKRELAARGADRVVAGNNASFLTAGGERWVMARNANHFMTDDEHRRTWHTMPRSFRAQVPYIRASMRRADVIVAPSQSMADRIIHILPALEPRITVRFHPLRPPHREQAIGRHILCPIVPSPYKYLPKRLTALQQALPENTDLTVVATADPADMPEALVSDPRFSFVGLLKHDELARRYADAVAVYYPTDVESFGYPLAEARASGTPVIALDAAHNHDVAGRMLCGFTEGDRESLAAAVERASTEEFTADPEPFDPEAYFNWMLCAA